MLGPLLPGTVPLPEPGKNRTTCPLLPATQPDAQQVNMTFPASPLAFSPAFSKKLLLPIVVLPGVRQVSNFLRGL